MKPYYYSLIFLFISCNKILPVTPLIGYTDKVSYENTEVSNVYLNSSQEIVGLYNIKNKLIDKVSFSSQFQITAQDSLWQHGFNYNVSFTYDLTNLTPGIYFWGNTIPFIVKEKEPKDITVVYPSNTINAYNNSGGKSLYFSNSSHSKEANTVSFLRPLPPNEEIAGLGFLKWIAYQNFSVNYICDLDLDNYSSFNNSKLLIIIGHSEYWTRKARQNFDQFIQSGNNAIILSGNTMWWQVRYNNDKNKLICYKDKNKDPLTDPLLKTILWRDKSLFYPILNSIGADFTNGGYGDKADNGWDGYKIINDKSPLLAGTDLKNGDIIPLKTHEYDGAPITYLGQNSLPTINNKPLGFYKIELVGYDLGFRTSETVGTFIVFQKTNASGIIINVGSSSWCKEEAFNVPLKKITTNMIELILEEKNVFSH